MLSRPSGPLVLTLVLDHATQSTLTALRSRYFPPHRNFLGAHITLFHAIPPHHIHDLDQRLQELCGRVQTFDLFIGEPGAMGKGGVMLKVRERPHSMQSIHLFVKSGMNDLTDQDERFSYPHVTILNKAEPDEVDNCLKNMKEKFKEQVLGSGEGLQLWEYQGGPWKPLKTYHFKA